MFSHNGLYFVIILEVLKEKMKTASLKNRAYLCAFATVQLLKESFVISN